MFCRDRSSQNALAKKLQTFFFLSPPNKHTCFIQKVFLTWSNNNCFLVVANRNALLWTLRAFIHDSLETLELFTWSNSWIWYFPEKNATPFGSTKHKHQSYYSYPASVSVCMVFTLNSINPLYLLIKNSWDSPKKKKKVNSVICLKVGSQASCVWWLLCLWWCFLC